MLIEFNFKNIFSFKEKNTLSMEAKLNEDKDLEKNSFKALNFDLLKTAIVYGSNASWKTNILKALHIFSWLVCHSNTTQPENPILNINLRSFPFMFDTKTQKEPIELSATFISEWKKYIYSISLSFNKVLKETLSVFHSKKETILIDRNANNMKLNMLWADQWKSSIRDNVLAVTALANFNIDEAIKVYRFFNNIHVFLPQSDINTQDTMAMLSTDPSFKSFLLMFLQTADEWIKDVKQTEQEMLFSKLSEQDKENIRKAAPNIQFNDNTRIKKSDIGFARNLYENEKIVNQISLWLQNESLWTMQLFTLIGSIYNVIKQGKILCIDEIDKSLHTRIVETIIKLVHNNKIEKKSQFIFNTHDTNLLGIKSLFRRDQIWFTEKDKYWATELISLLNYKPRKDSVIEKSYLEDKYWAILKKNDVDKNVNNLSSEIK